MSKLFLYALTLMIATFIVSGLNINNIFKKNHIWEAKFFVVSLILGISYILTNFLYDIVEIISNSI